MEIAQPYQRFHIRSAGTEGGRGRLQESARWAIGIALGCLSLSAGGAGAQVAPVVTSVSITNSPTSGDTYYGFAARIQARVDFDQDVVVGGSPRLALEVGSRSRHASYYYYSGASIFFVYLVQAEDMDSDGIGIPANALSLNGASITLASDRSVSAALEHGAVAGGNGRKVDGSAVAAPQVVSWYFQQSPRIGDTYRAGEEIYAAFEFDRAVTVTGEPRLPIQVGAKRRETTRWAHGPTSGFLDPLGTKLRLFYTVQEEDLDSDGISFPANSLTVVGGSITLVDRPDIPADLSHGAVADDPARKVDGSLKASITSVSFVEGPAIGDTYTLGETIQVLVEFDESVTLDQRVRLGVAIGTRTRQALIARGTSIRGESLTFEYLVQAADLDGDGTSIPADALTLNGGSVTADLSHEAVDADPNRKVNGSIVVTPKVESVTITSRPRRAGDGNGFPVYGDTYGVGELIVVRVDFDKPVRTTGKPQVAIVIGGDTRQATYTGRVFPYRSTFFEYVVQAGDTDSDGISIPANALTLNGGSIRMLGDVTTAAELTHHDAAASDKVDGAAAAAPRVLYGAFGVFLTGPADSESYRRGETIEVGVRLDRRVEVNGEPHLALEIGGRTRQASFRELFARGSNVFLFFEYVVQAEDMDGDGIGIPANSLTLNGGAITLAGAPAVVAELTHGPSGPFGKVDGSTFATPGVTQVDTVWQPASGGSYGLGETIHGRACFSGGVRVAGRPPVGPSDRWPYEASLLPGLLLPMWVLPVHGAGGGLGRRRHWHS